MDRDFIEETVSKYMELIFGFALVRTKNIEKAEDLSSDIIFEVYKVLSKLEDAENQNIAGYVYKISCRVYARYLQKNKKDESLIQDSIRYGVETTHHDEFELNETHDRLRKEISYLGKTQREIIRMHYYEFKTLNEIAELLNIPIGYVKWHLFDARKQLKEGMEMPTQDSNKKQIKFSGMAQHGTRGTEGQHIGTYLNTLLRQNIAYSAYHSAKTITEIARDLATPSEFIENEIATLEEYGYIDRISGSKYLTNFMIYEPTIDILEKKHQIFTKYANIVCENYVPLVFKAMKNYDNSMIYSPKNDLNFLMWSIVSFATGFKLVVDAKSAPLKKFHVHRKDGGDNIAFAWLQEDFKWDELSYLQKVFHTVGESSCFENKKRLSWQFNTYHDSRDEGSKDNFASDYRSLYEFYTGKLPKTDAHIEKFIRLYDKGYLIRRKDSEYVNMVVMKYTTAEIIDILPKMPNKLKIICKELDEEIYAIEKTQFPARFHELCKIWNTDILSSPDVRTRVLNQLSKADILKPLTDEQKMSVNTIMFADELPEKYI